jgi:hypothetical protein
VRPTDAPRPAGTARTTSFPSMNPVRQQAAAAIKGPSTGIRITCVEPQSGAKESQNISLCFEDGKCCARACMRLCLCVCLAVCVCVSEIVCV